MRRAPGTLVAALWFSAGLLISAGASGASGADTLDMNQRLVRSDVLRADFQQEKKLRALSRPLRSHGKLIFAAGAGVLWQLLEPYAVFVLMKPGEIVEWSPGGEKRRARTDANPVFRAMTDVILATLSGDSNGLQQHFHLSPGSAETGWQLSLRPRSEALAAAVSSVEVFGDRFVERVEITESRGDLTTIRFSGFSVEPPELEADEKDYFAQ